MASVTVSKQGDKRVPRGCLDSVHAFNNGYVRRYEKAHPEGENTIKMSIIFRPHPCFSDPGPYTIGCHSFDLNDALFDA